MMNDTETYFMQMQPPLLDGLFGADDTTPVDGANVPPRATEREERAVADATRLEHMAKRPRRASIDERFADFLRDHANVVNAVVVVSRQMKAAGLEHWSVDAAFHVVRFQRFTSVHIQAALYGNSMPVLNNDFAAPLARWIMERFPDLNGFYETRKRKGDL